MSILAQIIRFFEFLLYVGKAMDVEEGWKMAINMQLLSWKLIKVMENDWYYYILCLRGLLDAKNCQKSDFDFYIFLDS